MRHRYLVLIAVTAGLTLGLSPRARAEASTRQPQPDAATASYSPGVGDLMTGGVQPHHIKLGLAGQAGNWPLAAYELDEIKESLDDVKSLHPAWNDLPLATWIDAWMAKPLAAVEGAIASRDAQRFTAALRQLDDGCNACHRDSGRGFIVIRAPQGSSFSDQDFRPAQP